jgi:AcrR family transcriptional regulator
MTAVVAEKWTPERRRQRTRNALLDAAQEVFVRRGFDGASLDEIAETAGYTRGAIYKHFDSKEDLFYAVNERINEQTLEEFTAQFPDVEHIEDHVHDIATTWRGFLLRDRDFMILQLEMFLYSLRNPAVLERSRAQRRRTRAMVADMIKGRSAEEGIKFRAPPETLAAIFLTASDGFAQASLIEPDAVDNFEAFMRLMIEGMFADTLPADDDQSLSTKPTTSTNSTSGARRRDRSRAP